MPKGIKHTLEFKREAVNLAQSKNKPVSQIAQELGIKAKLYTTGLATPNILQQDFTANKPNENALIMALYLRQMPTNVIVHSDRGTQYCSTNYKNYIN